MKHEVLEAFGTGAAVARALGIGRASVSLWRDDEPIPALRELQLRTLYPTVFGPPLQAVIALKHPLRRATDVPQIRRRKKKEAPT